MTKAKSGPLNEDDIVTPSAQDKAADQGGSGLRMPPIIDISPSLGARLIDGAKTVLRGTLYQASLIALLLMALGLMVLTLMQAGNITPPDWRQLAVSRDAAQNGAQEAAPVVLSDPPAGAIQQPLAAEDRAPAELPQNQATGETAAPSRAQDAPNNAAPTPTSTPTADMESELAALRQTLADTRRDLAAAQAALLEKQAVTSGAELAQLTQRAALAELILRLDDGVAFDDLLDGGQLDAVLHKNELAALALHAARGVPTEAGILAQAETLPFIIGARAAAEGGGETLPALFGWLADKAPNLIRVRQSPMAGAQKQLRLLYTQLHARDYRAAAATTRLLVLTYDEEADAQSEAALALQALYADLRAFSETRAARTDLRRDYMAGVRP